MNRTDWQCSLVASGPTRLGLLTCAAALLAGPAIAQEPTVNPTPTDFFADLEACRKVTEADQRLACYDAKVAAMVAARDAGEVRIVDREDVTRTRRQLFGFSVPDLDILKGGEQDKEASEVLSTTITSARQLTASSWRFTTAEAAVWEINNAPRRLSPIKAGDKVVFKKAALGYYFIRINGQIGVKGTRVK